MHEALHTNTPVCRGGPRFVEAFDRLARVLVDGLQHGFFDYSLSCEVVKGGKRQFVIKAGKSHLFTIPEDELPR